MTLSFFLLICAVAIFCGLAVVYLPRLPLPHYLCATLRLTALLLFIFTAPLGAYGLIEAYCNHLAPTRDTVLASLHACTANPDRAAVLAALRKPCNYAALEDSHFGGNSFVYFPPEIIDQAASSIFAHAGPVQNENPKLFARRTIMAIFLFDSHQRLLTWSYAMRYPHD